MGFISANLGAPLVCRFQTLDRTSRIDNNAVPDGRKIHCRHGIKKTSGQAAQPRAQAHVVFSSHKSSSKPSSEKAAPTA